MWKVIATIAQRPTHDYPFAVFAVDPEGQHRQETTCRSLRDCLLVGNGVLAGLMAAGERTEANVSFDERLGKSC